LADKGGELICHDLGLQDCANGVTLDIPWPGKATDTGFIEALSRRIRAERLNARRHCRLGKWRVNHGFMTLADACEKPPASGTFGAKRPRRVSAPRPRGRSPAEMEKRGRSGQLRAQRSYGCWLRRLQSPRPDRD
jgi:hypothetical protein